MCFDSGEQSTHPLPGGDHAPKRVKITRSSLGWI
jgi:hypothetical protein